MGRVARLPGVSLAGPAIDHSRGEVGVENAQNPGNDQPAGEKDEQSFHDVAVVELAQSGKKGQEHRQGGILGMGLPARWRRSAAAFE